MSHRFPTVSVIVPCRNEDEHIEACIRSILAQEQPPGGFEVIIVDGMSTDGTKEILYRLGEEDPRVRVIENPARFTPSGMNAGIRESRGRYIAIMGAHNRYAPDYLYQSLKVLEETDADNVGGAMFCESDSWTQRAVAAAHHSPFSVGGARWHNPDYEGVVDTVFGGVYRRETFDRFGVFDEELARNQDDEFNLRLTRAGGKIWQSPRIRSWYKPRGSLPALFRQYMQYGYWKVRVIQKHRLPASIRHLVPACFVFTFSVLPMISPWVPNAIWVWLGLLVIYSFANITASFVTAARHRWRLFIFLPVVFAIYHFAYGYGFLHGIWDFLVLRRMPSHTYTDLTHS